MERELALVQGKSQAAYQKSKIKFSRGPLARALDEIVTEACHRHPSHEYCLEILVAEGIFKRIRDLVGKTIGMHGIQQVKTMPMPI